MRKYIFVFLLFLVSCGPPPPPKEGIVAEKKFKDAWTESTNFYYGCSWDIMEGETKCKYGYHFTPEITNHPAEYYVAIVNGDVGEWIRVNECLYNVLDVGEFYSELENYGCEE